MPIVVYQGWQVSESRVGLLKLTTLVIMTTVDCDNNSTKTGVVLFKS